MTVMMMKQKSDGSIILLVSWGYIIIRRITRVCYLCGVVMEDAGRQCLKGQI